MHVNNVHSLAISLGKPCQQLININIYSPSRMETTQCIQACRHVEEEHQITSNSMRKKANLSVFELDS